MSVTELFTQRYRARIESVTRSPSEAIEPRGLFDDDLYLHSYRELAEDAAERLWSEAETENHHVSEEGALRAQVWRAIANANEKHKVKDLPRRARQRMADAYLQSREPFRGARPTLLTKICDTGLEWVFTPEGQAPDEAPFNGSKWSVASNLLVFDFVEVFFDLLPSDDQLDFSRDLNTRLQRGASRWYFQLGRWRRDDWPRDRDDQFDLILYSLNRQADTALERRRNAGAAGGDGSLSSDQGEFDPEAASASLQAAARALWQADRLLTSDLLSDKVRHSAAVRAARMAFDACLSSFGGVVRGPFVKGKPPREVRRGVFGGRLSRRSNDEGKAALKGVEHPRAAAIRLKRLGEALESGAPGLSREDHIRLLERANLAEFLVRLALFELPAGKSDPEDAEAEEVRRYSKLTAAPGATGGPLVGPRLNHGAGTVHLQLEDKATARLAVDLLARLCQFSTGAATHTGGAEPAGLLAEAPGLHPRQLDHQREKVMGRIAIGAGLVLGAAALFAAGVVVGGGLPL
ncbi:MAG: hypothetical protein RKE49_14270 [Oceanicaulis sp.]